MTAPRKRTPAETWKALEELRGREAPPGDEEVDRVLALSDEELDRELVAGGFDAKALRAHGEQIGNEAARASIHQAERTVAINAALRPPKRRARTVWLLAAALAAMAVVAVRAARVGPPNVAHPRPIGTETAGPDAMARARELRSAGGVACAAERWRACLDRLDSAQSLDPAGDADPAIQAERARAQAGLAATPSP